MMGQNILLKDGEPQTEIQIIMTEPKRWPIDASNRPSLKRDKVAFSSTRDTRHHSLFPSRFTAHQPVVSPINLDANPLPRISTNVQRVEERLTSKKKRQTFSDNLQTTETRDRIIAYMKHDDNLSSAQAKLRPDHFYYHVGGNMCTFGDLPIPKEVLQEYEVARIKAEFSEKLLFNRGFLPDICYVYYSVGNVLFLINVAPCIRLRKPSPPVRVQLKWQIDKVIEGRLPRTIIQGTAQKVLIVTHYEAISFYAPIIDDAGQLMVKDLFLHIRIPGEVILEASATKDGDIYYIDRDGYLHSISDIPVKKFLVFKTGYRQLYDSCQQPTLASQMLRKYGEESLYESVKSFSKYFVNRWRKFTAKMIECRGIFVDESKKVIVAHITRIYSKEQQVSSISVYKIGQNKSITVVNQYDEGELFKIFASFGVFPNSYSQFFILKIAPVQPNSIADSNVQIILKNGIRVIAEIAKTYAKPLKVIYPPNISDGHLKRGKGQITPVQVNSQKVGPIMNTLQQLVEIAIKRQTSLLFFKQSSRHVSILMSQLNSTSKSVVGQVHWNSFGGIRSAEPTEVNVWPLRDAAAFPHKLSEVIYGTSTKEYFPINDLHELAKQVYTFPDFFICLTEKESQMMMKLRPIDIVVTWLMNLGLQDCKVKLQEMINVWSRVQIIHMLLMILSDPGAVYYTSSSIERNLKNQVSSKQSRIEINLISSPRQPPRIIKQEDIGFSSKQKASQLFVRLGAIQQPIKQDDDQIIDIFYSGEEMQKKDLLHIKPQGTKQQALCLYISRLLRPVWWKKSVELVSSNTKLIEDKLLSLINYLKENSAQFSYIYTSQQAQGQNVPRARQTLVSQLQGFLLRSLQLLKFIKTVYRLPQREFRHIISQDSKYFQPFLFDELSKNDSTAVSIWQVDFSRLLEERFFKLARLYYKCRQIQSESLLINQCQQFGQLPDYFLDDLQYTRAIRVQGLRRQHTKTTKQQIIRQLVASGNLEQKYEHSVQLIPQCDNIEEKLKFTQIAIECLQSILQSRGNVYRNTKKTYEADYKQLKDRRKGFLIQKALKEALFRGKPDMTIIQLLDKNEVQPSNLKQSVLRSQDQTVIFIWYLNYPPTSTNEYDVAGALDRIIEINSINWPNNIKDHLRYILGSVDKQTKKSILHLFVGKLQTANLGVYYDIFRGQKCEILVRKNSPYWLANLLIAEGFSQQDILAQYSKRLRYSIDQLNSIDANQTLPINVLYWLLALDQIHRCVGAHRSQPYQLLVKDCLRQLEGRQFINPSRQHELRAHLLLDDSSY